MRRLLLTGTAVLALTGCGGTSEGDNGYVCSGRTCVLTYTEPGRRDLTKELGTGATFDLERVGDGRVDALVGGAPVTLVLNAAQDVGRYSVLLRTAEPDLVSIRVVRT